jgi:ketosteroid isomerase-like protein
MTSQQLENLLLKMYGAYAAKDAATMDALLTDESVLHVPGTHPLSGSHRGRAAVWTYLGRVSAVAKGEGGFEVQSIAADGDGHAAVLVVGTICNYVRPLVHVWQAADERLLEYREVPFDQVSEDAFWNGVFA